MDVFGCSGIADVFGQMNGFEMFTHFVPFAKVFQKCI